MMEQNLFEGAGEEKKGQGVNLRGFFIKSCENHILHT
jgi:hypothetical protein